MDSLGALTAFMRAADARSFTEAGRQLSLSSSAVGKAVGRLEERLGVSLFHRSTRSITLTEDGKMFLDSCHRILAEFQSVEQEFASSKGLTKGRLKVSLPLVGMLMIPALAQFMKTYPDIELDMDFSDNLVNVIEDGFDVVIRTGDGDNSRLMARVLGSYRMEVVGSPSYLAASGTPLRPDELASHACMHHKYPTTGRIQRWPFARTEGDRELIIPVAASSSTIEPLVYLAELGMGLTCVPDFAIRRQVADGSLKIVLADHIEHAGVFRAVWPSSRYASPKLRVFIDFLAAHLFHDVVARPPTGATSEGWNARQ